MKNRGAFYLFMSLNLVACGVPNLGEDSPAKVLQSKSTYGQGTEIQGTEIQGTEIQGTEIQGTEIQGTEIQGTEIQGTLLSAITIEGLRLSGPELIGATMVGVTSGGGTISLQIQNVELDSQDPTGQTWLYTILGYNTQQGSWQNICRPDPTGMQKAIPLSGVWDATGAAVASASRFTFACTSGVLAKCVRWGYRPWQTHQGTSLAAAHQACTRMARADYCGKGISHTHNGTLIDIADVMGIQSYDPNDGMVFEAAWLPSGAYCISKARWNLIGADLLLECPEKLTSPDPSDLMNAESCAMKLTTAPRSAVLMSNRSLIQAQISL